MFPILFLAYTCYFINTWEVEVNGKVGYVIQHISEQLTDANSFNLIFVKGTNLKIISGFLIFLLETHIKCIYCFLQLSVLPYMKLIPWLHLG